jgi:release factor glutamine methyltransferase
LLDTPFGQFDEIRFHDYIKRLLQSEPIQYLFNEAYFMGNVFFVNEHTLIPRPETEELVQLIVKENTSTSGLRILDIGTGSGCIPISLSLLLPNNEYFAIDISTEALNVATLNAKKMEAKVQFLNVDILKPNSNEMPTQKLDVIVSNPPYVLDEEKSMMQRNVLDFEPHLALFVPNDDALLFYNRILQFSKLNLKPFGRVFFEINETKGNEILALFEKHHFYDAEIRNDFNNKARFAIGTYTPR